MKKVIVFTMLLITALSLVACGKDNNPPAISGNAKDSVILLGESFNVILGVHVSDLEDGDIRDQFEVSIEPAITIAADGSITPTEKGKFTITYTVTDSGGLTDIATGTLTVTAELLNVPSTSGFRPSKVLLLENGTYLNALGLAGTWSFVNNVFTVTPYVGVECVGGINDKNELTITMPGQYFPENFVVKDGVWQAALGESGTYVIPAVYN